MMSIQRTIALVNLLIIALGAYFAAGLIYQIWGLQSAAPESKIAVSPPQPQATQNVSKPFAAYRQILQRDLFKTRREAVTPSQSTDINLEGLEATKLKLKLWGTVTGDSDNSYAVIENMQNRQQNLYRVGDSIQNATLKAILRSKVVLSVNGTDEVLAIEDIKQGIRPAATVPTSRPSGPAPGGIRAQRISLRRNMINDAIQDVSKLMTEIKITPHMGTDGQPMGLSLSNIKPNSIFRRMGLRNGDVLKSVDGQEIQSVDDALRLYENLKSADNVSLTIQRRGRDRNINYMIR